MTMSPAETVAVAAPLKGGGACGIVALPWPSKESAAAAGSGAPEPPCTAIGPVVALALGVASRALFCSSAIDSLVRCSNFLGVASLTRAAIFTASDLGTSRACVPASPSAPPWRHGSTLPPAVSASPSRQGSGVARPACADSAAAAAAAASFAAASLPSTSCSVNPAASCLCLHSSRRAGSALATGGSSSTRVQTGSARSSWCAPPPDATPLSSLFESGSSS